MITHFTHVVCANVGSVHNTLYVEVHCPVIKPDVIVVSSSGQMVTDFGQVSVGQRVVKCVVVQNISDHTVDVTFCSLKAAPGWIVVVTGLAAFPLRQR